MRRRVSLILIALIALTAACAGSQGQGPQTQTRPATSVAGGASDSGQRPRRPRASPHDSVRDLSIDESMGGHTLMRHVGRTDTQLAERLRREPEISAASTWTDRDTAERAVGAALASSDGKLTSWERRQGRRPNLVLHYTDPNGETLGRSLSRGEQSAVPCTRALVVLKWDERRDRFYVLTAYPEADR